MHVINADFRPLDEVPVTELFGRIGVYVLWSARAAVRPSYLGEGNVLRRLATEHVERFGERAVGYVALLEGTERRAKQDAQILEAALLHVGAQIDQRPAQNRSDGIGKSTWKLFDAGHGAVRANVSGYHPLRLNAKLARRHALTIRREFDGDSELMRVEHPWRRISSAA